MSRRKLRTWLRRLQWMLAAGFLPGCFPMVCAQPVSADHSERDPATGMAIVTTRCGADVRVRKVCATFGKHRTAAGWDIFCDGEVIDRVDLSKDVTP